MPPAWFRRILRLGAAAVILENLTPSDLDGAERVAANRRREFGFGWLYHYLHDRAGKRGRAISTRNPPAPSPRAVNPEAEVDRQVATWLWSITDADAKTWCLAQVRARPFGQSLRLDVLETQAKLLVLERVRDLIIAGRSLTSILEGP
jgi:hypothetical protein